MKTEKPFELQTSGSLTLKAGQNTLAQLEEFCAEARRLGLPDNARLFTARQGMLGPIAGWYFSVPVEPKKLG
jgi:hypothetical protein